MHTLFYVVMAVVTVLVVAAAWSVVVAMRRARSGEPTVELSASMGSGSDSVALRLRLRASEGPGRCFVRAIALEGDLARALSISAPVGFTDYLTADLRYENFEPDLDALADRLDRERPKTVELSSVIERLQREQFDQLRRLRDEIDAVQFNGNVPIGAEVTEIVLPGIAIPEAAGRIWVTTQRRIGAATVEDVVIVDLPLVEPPVRPDRGDPPPEVERTVESIRAVVTRS